LLDGVRNAETIELGEEALWRLDTLDRCRVIAENWPALGDPRQEMRAVLEA
jgi:hypothetical protein